MTNRHLIGRQVILLEVNSSTESDAIHQKISALYWDVIVPELNKLFDALVGDKEIVRFDSIELDIGNISLNKNFEAEIVDKVIQRLKESFLREQNDVEHKIPTEYRPKLSTLQRPLREHYFDIWLYWLEHGALPSYSTTPEKNWLRLVFETLGLHVKAVDRLHEVIRKAPVALQRLIIQHSNEELQAIVELHSGFPQDDLVKMINELQSLSTKSRASITVHDFRGIEIAIWKAVLTLAILKRQKLESAAFASYVSKIPLVKKIFQKIGINETSEITKYPFLNEFIKKEHSEATKHLQQKNKNSEEKSIQVGEQGVADPNTKIEVDGDTSKEALTESPQFFKNAGVILLHPFLSELFKKLKLLKDSEFKNFECQTKAVLLLHFLATGDKKPKEYEMVLPKFLCGMPSNLPLDHTLSLSEAAKNEAQNVLQAAIDHWGALGSTSPEGLQEGFLIRDGKFIKEQSGWKLYVAQKAQDILLDKLPWNLSMIKLPWMKEMLKVEWR